MGYVKDCEKCSGSFDVNMFYFCPYCYAGEEVKDLNLKLTDAQAEIARLQSALDVAVEGLVKADVDMRCARQTAFESVFRDILHQGTVDVLAALDKIKQIKNSTQ